MNREYQRKSSSSRPRIQKQSWWQRHRAWVAGLSRGQKIRYRLFQIVVVLSIAIIGIWAALNAWIRPPEIPVVPPPSANSSQGEDPMDFGGELPNVARSGRKEGVYTFLLVGQDTAGGGNTDTMMLVTFDSVGKKVYGMSLPRDTMVNVGTGSKRLNAVYNYNKGRDKETQVEKGITALKKEVGKLTGITPDFYVVVQWEAVGEMVDALGGVWFEVPFDMDYDDPTPGQELHIHLDAGYQKLNGEQAMGLIRWRHNNDFSVQYPTGDLGRVETQQAFLQAVAEECLKPSTLLKAPTLANIFMENVITDLSIGNLLAFAQLAYGMDAEQDVIFYTMPNQDARYPGVSMVLPIQDELLEILNHGFNPYLDDIQSSDLQILYRKSDGSYGVTSGTLQDPSLGRPRRGSGSGQSSGGSKPTTPTEPETPDISTPPDGSQIVPPDSSQTTPPDGSQIVPPDGSQTTPPDGSQIVPPDGSQTTPPDGSQIVPPDGSQITPPGGSQIVPPDGSQTTPPDSSQTDPAEGAGESSSVIPEPSLPEPPSASSGSGELGTGDVEGVFPELPAA